MRKILFFAFCLLMLCSCSADGIPGVVTITAPAPTPGPATQTPFTIPSPLPSLTFGPLETPGIPTLMPTLTPTVTATFPPTRGSIPLYIIEANMDYDAKRLNITQQIVYPNNTGKSLDEIVLVVQPNLVAGAFALASMWVNDVRASAFKLEGQKLEWILPTPLAPGETVKLSLVYTLSLPVIVQGDPNVLRPKIFGVTDLQVNLVDWYPFVAPYRDGGWVLHEPWYYGEHLVYDKADFDVTLGFSNNENLPVVAASAAAETVRGGARYRLENARDFAFSMGRQLKVVSQEMEGGITVYNYYLGESNKPAAQAVLDATVKAVKTYTELFGPYPHKTLSVVQGDFNDGMEFDGLYFLAKSFYNLYDDSKKEETLLVTLAAHETAHQWWFGRVANDQAQEPWLDEALAMYCEKLFYEKNYPDDLNWWWSTRVDLYQPSGYVDTQLYMGGGFTPYTNAIYRMGAHFLEDLRTQIGDETFFAFLKDYSTQMDGKISTSADFFRILRAHTSENISGLMTKYFEKAH